MTAPARGFPVAEYEGRLTRAQALMGKAGLAGMLLTTEAEIEKITHICGVASRTFARVPDFAGAGRPLDDVFRAFRRACLEEGADDVPCLVGGADQGGHHDVISPPPTRGPRGRCPSPAPPSASPPSPRRRSGGSGGR